VRSNEERNLEKRAQCWRRKKNEREEEEEGRTAETVCREGSQAR
jgi:hypothetical protein